MADSLIQRFMREEAGDEVRALLLSAIEGWRRGEHRETQEFEFNKYDVAFDFAAGVVKVDDDLDTSAGGEASCGIEEFEALLRGA